MEEKNSLVLSERDMETRCVNGDVRGGPVWVFFRRFLTDLFRFRWIINYLCWRVIKALAVLNILIVMREGGAIVMLIL